MSLWNRLRQRLRVWGLNPSLIAVIAVGAFAATASRIFATSVDGYLIENARRLLTADAAVTAARPLEDADFARLDAETRVLRKADEIEFVSVVQSGDSNLSALVEIHAVDAHFPLSGEFTQRVGDSNELTTFRGRPDGPFDLWVTADAASLLDLKIDQSIKLGAQPFQIRRIVESAPGQSRASFGFAPKFLIRFEDVSATGLIGPGSIAYYRRYLEFFNSEAVTAEKLKSWIANDELAVRTPTDSVRGFERASEAILIFLGVIALIQLAMGGAAAFAVSAQDRARVLKVAALEAVLGASTARLRMGVLRVFILNSMLGLLAAAAGAFALLSFARPTIDRLMQKAVPGVSFHLHVPLWDVFGMAVGVFACAYLLAAPVLRRLKTGIHLQALIGVSDLSIGEIRLQLGTAKSRLWPKRTDLELVLPFLVLGIGFFSVGILVLKNFKNGVAVVSGLVGLAVFLWVIAGPLLKAFATTFQISSQGWVHILSQLLSRPRLTSRLTFVVVGFASFLATTLTVLGLRMLSEYAVPASRQIPDYFAFNIPDAELKDVEDYFASHGAELKNPSPLIMARLLKKNDADFEDNAQTQRITQFPVRVTFREELSDSETFVAGSSFAELRDQGRPKDALAMVSLESRFAQQMGIELGDTLTFDIQGIELKAEVVSFRAVRWIEFQPNFFISFERGPLEDAPKTWISAIYQSVPNPKLSANAQSRFTGLSLLNVREAISRIVGLLGALVVPIQIGVAFSIVVAVLLLLVSVLVASSVRKLEIALMGALGATPRWLTGLLMAEYGNVGLVAGAIGAGLGLAASGAAGWLLFGWVFQFHGTVALMAALSGGMLGLFLGYRISRSLRLQLGKSIRLV